MTDQKPEERERLRITTPLDMENIMIEQGLYDVIIGRAVEMTQYNQFLGASVKKISLEFTIVSPGPMYGRVAYGSYTPRITPNSTLYRVIKNALKKDLSPEDFAKIEYVEDIDAMLRMHPLQLFIIHKVSNRGRKYYSIANYLESNLVITPQMVNLVEENNNKAKVNPLAQKVLNKEVPEETTQEHSETPKRQQEMAASHAVDAQPIIKPAQPK